MIHATDPVITASLPAIPEALRPETNARIGALFEAVASLPESPGGAPGWRGQLARVFAASEFVARSCAREPALLAGLIGSGELFRAYAPGELTGLILAATAAAGDEAALSRTLRRQRAREMVRIAWRDLTGMAALDETVADLSALAEACLDGALDRLHGWAAQKHGAPRGQPSGRPQRLVVLAMGKLGGRELNFSSDIDLIFCYPEEGECETASAPDLTAHARSASGSPPSPANGRGNEGEGARGPRTRVPDVPPITPPIGEQGLSNQEFFARLGRALIRALHENTADGFVFRVDMRLRPNGESGPLALSFEAMEHYYQLHGRDWERYAFIKARVVAGDRAAGAELLATLKPFVYRKYLDYGAIESIRTMKAMIEREMARQGMNRNIKLGRGGIREIEFIVQTHQLIRAGREPSLQEPNARRVLAALRRAGYLETEAAIRLDAAYVFLRDVEHRLQMVEDRQTQRLPDDEPGQLRLAFACGFSDWPTFLAALDGHRQAVHEQFSVLFRQAGEEQGAPDSLVTLWQGQLDDEAAGRLLREQGYAESGEVLALLQSLRTSGAYLALSTTGRERVDRVVPMILAQCGRSPAPLATLQRLVQVLEAIGRRTAYFALMAENPPVVKQLVSLAGASPWIANWIARHPLLLDELLNPALARLPVPAQLHDELRERLAQLPADDLELQMEVLREFRHGHVLRVAAADLGTKLDPLETGGALAAIADTVVGESLRLAERDLQKRHGRPRCPGHASAPGLAVIGYGKLGSRELGYGSDLDMIFLYEGCDNGESDGERPLPNESWFARLGQRLIHLLTTRTAGGLLYEVDMRLRPSGKSGPLVASLDSFERYQTTEAWTWEHQALVRARPVAGDPGVIAEFARLRAAILCRPRDPAGLVRDVLDMRARMRESHGSRESGLVDLKHDRGGIVDIEFMVQYWVLRWAAEHPALIRQTDNIHILQALAGEGLLDPKRAAFLEEGYRRYLSLEHHLKLQEQGSLLPAAQLGDLPERVRQVWKDEFNEE